jgi:hypothetical protein
MASTTETGHAKNVANFQDLIEFVTGYGATYNPSKNSLKLPQLIALKASAEGNLVDVISKNTNYNNKVGVSLQSFALLRWAVPVALTSFHSTDHLKPKLRASMKNRSSFLLSMLPIFTRSLIAFVRAT